MANGNAISVAGLTKNYGTFEAVRSIQFDVREGETFGLLGPNGAGKTTTVEILEGLRQRTAGDVQVLDFDPDRQKRELKDRIGVCLQATNLPDKITVQEALDLFGAFYTRTVDSGQLLKRLQLWDKRNAGYATLSGGQKQRLALAMALSNDPQMLFLDEPTTGLDPQVRLEIRDLLEELHREKRTILLTTHYIEEAERLCDRVAIVDAGKIIELGTPREIQQRVLGHTAVEITTDRAMPLDHLPENLRAEKYSIGDDGRTLSMQSESPAALIVELVRWIGEWNLRLVDIHMKRPTLEDVFIELTGKKLRE
jgi:ABC-2 type transport system ATP-binding protein